MGMYTELVLGCSIKNNPAVVEAINWLLNPNNEDTQCPAILPSVGRMNWMFNSGGSYYFGAASGQHTFVYDKISDCWRLNARFNIKNYEEELETFLKWLQPYVEQGSGTREWWASTIYEEADEPTNYYLRSANDD